MATPRPYSNQLRTEQAAMTRDRIVDTAVELLSRGDAAEIGMQDVADHAGVSVRTVYRNFATREDLFDGVVRAIGERMKALAGPPPGGLDDAIESTPDAVRAVFELEPLYRALLATQAGRESHQRASSDRRGWIYAVDLGGLGETETKLFGALVHLLSTSHSVLFLKDYWGLDTDELGRALQWALAMLTDAIRDPERRGRL